jgi:lysozyme
MSKLSDQLRIHEGVRKHVYLCSAGYETIGVGRNIADSGLGLSDDEIDYLLENDITRCRKELETYSWFSDLDEVRQDALINMCFNLGLSRLANFKSALSSMAVGAYADAAEHFLDSRWASQVGNRAQEVAHMIRTGEYP